MNLEAIRNTRLCSNAKPPIDHRIKHQQEADLKCAVAEFMAKGGKVEKLNNVIKPSNSMPCCDGAI
jgi:hypothetical protein